MTTAPHRSPARSCRGRAACAARRCGRSSRSIELRPPRSGRPSAWPMVAGTSSGSVIGASSTKKTPSRERAQGAARHLEAEARLARAAGPGERQQPVVGRAVRVISPISRAAPEEGRQPASAGCSAPRRATRAAGSRSAAPSTTSCHSRSGRSRSLSRCSPRSRSSTPSGSASADQRARRVREEHLAAVPDAGDAAGAVHVEADVALARRSWPRRCACPSGRGPGRRPATARAASARCAAAAAATAPAPSGRRRRRSRPRSRPRRRPRASKAARSSSLVSREDRRPSARRAPGAAGSTPRCR